MLINSDTILTVCSIITSVAGASGIIVKVIKSQLTKLTDKTKNETKEELKTEVIQPMLDELNQKYTSSLDDVTHNINNILVKLEELNNVDIESQETSIAFKQCTLKGLIVQAHGTYMQLGHISKYVMATLEEIFEAYRNLGGNHYVLNLMDDLRKLPPSNE